MTITATSSNNITSAATLSVVASQVTAQAPAGSLPVGFQSQLFASSGSPDAAGNPVTSSNVMWSSPDASTVSVDAATGVVTAHASGSTIITATAQSDGTSSGSATVITDVAPVGPDARVGHNTELGVPTDANPSDDVIIARRQYTLSYNAAHHVVPYPAGTLLPSSPTTAGNGSSIFLPYTFVAGVSVTPGDVYVAFLSSAGVQQSGNGYNQFAGTADTYNGGQFVYGFSNDPTT